MYTQNIQAELMAKAKVNHWNLLTFRAEMHALQAFSSAEEVVLIMQYEEWLNR